MNITPKTHNQHKQFKLWHQFLCYPPLTLDNPTSKSTRKGCFSTLDFLWGVGQTCDFMLASLFAGVSKPLILVKLSRFQCWWCHSYLLLFLHWGFHLFYILRTKVTIIFTGRECLGHGGQLARWVSACFDPLSHLQEFTLWTELSLQQNRTAMYPIIFI